jgi:hypothetical protein
MRFILTLSAILSLVNAFGIISQRQNTYTIGDRYVERTQVTVECRGDAGDAGVTHNYEMRRADGSIASVAFTCVAPEYSAQLSLVGYVPQGTRVASADICQDRISSGTAVSIPPAVRLTQRDWEETEGVWSGGRRLTWLEGKDAHNADGGRPIDTPDGRARRLAAVGVGGKRRLDDSADAAGRAWLKQNLGGDWTLEKMKIMVDQLQQNSSVAFSQIAELATKQDALNNATNARFTAQDETNAQFLASLGNLTSITDQQAKQLQSLEAAAEGTLDGLIASNQLTGALADQVRSLNVDVAESIKAQQLAATARSETLDTIRKDQAAANAMVDLIAESTTTRFDQVNNVLDSTWALISNTSAELQSANTHQLQAAKEYEAVQLQRVTDALSGAIVGLDASHATRIGSLQTALDSRLAALGDATVAGMESWEAEHTAAVKTALQSLKSYTDEQLQLTAKNSTAVVRSFVEWNHEQTTAAWESVTDTLRTLTTRTAWQLANLTEAFASQHTAQDEAIVTLVTALSDLRNATRADLEDLRAVTWRTARATRQALAAQRTIHLRTHARRKLSVAIHTLQTILYGDNYDRYAIGGPYDAPFVSRWGREQFGEGWAPIISVDTVVMLRAEATWNEAAPPNGSAYWLTTWEATLRCPTEVLLDVGRVSLTWLDLLELLGPEGCAVHIRRTACPASGWYTSASYLTESMRDAGIIDFAADTRTALDDDICAGPIVVEESSNDDDLLRSKEAVASALGNVCREPLPADTDIIIRSGVRYTKLAGDYQITDANPLPADACVSSLASTWTHPSGETRPSIPFIVYSQWARAFAATLPTLAAQEVERWGSLSPDVEYEEHALVGVANVTSDTGRVCHSGSFLSTRGGRMEPVYKFDPQGLSSYARVRLPPPISAPDGTPPTWSDRPTTLIDPYDRYIPTGGLWAGHPDCLLESNCPWPAPAWDPSRTGKQGAFLYNTQPSTFFYTDAAVGRVGTPAYLWVPPKAISTEDEATGGGGTATGYAPHMPTRATWAMNVPVETSSRFSPWDATVSLADFWVPIDAVNGTRICADRSSSASTADEGSLCALLDRYAVVQCSNAESSCEAQQSVAASACAVDADPPTCIATVLADAWLDACAAIRIKSAQLCLRPRTWSYTSTFEIATGRVTLSQQAVFGCPSDSASGGLSARRISSDTWALTITNAHPDATRPARLVIADSFGDCSRSMRLSLAPAAATTELVMGCDPSAVVSASVIAWTDEWMNETMTCGSKGPLMLNFSADATQLIADVAGPALLMTKQVSESTAAIELATAAADLSGAMSQTLTAATRTRSISTADAETAVAAASVATALGRTTYESIRAAASTLSRLVPRVVKLDTPAYPANSITPSEVPELLLQVNTTDWAQLLSSAITALPVGDNITSNVWSSIVGGSESVESAVTSARAAATASLPDIDIVSVADTIESARTAWSAQASATAKSFDERLAEAAATSDTTSAAVASALSTTVDAMANLDAVYEAITSNTADRATAANTVMANIQALNNDLTATQVHLAEVRDRQATVDAMIDDLQTNHLPAIAALQRKGEAATANITAAMFAVEQRTEDTLAAIDTKIAGVHMLLSINATFAGERACKDCCPTTLWYVLYASGIVVGSILVCVGVQLLIRYLYHKKKWCKWYSRVR